MLLLRHTLKESSRLSWLSWIVILNPDPAPSSLPLSLPPSKQVLFEQLEPSNWYRLSS